MDQVIEKPQDLLQFQSQIELIPLFLEELQEPYQIVLAAQFSNLRTIYQWQDLKLEVDETNYSFGKAYEMEGLFWVFHFSGMS